MFRKKKVLVIVNNINHQEIEALKQINQHQVQLTLLYIDISIPAFYYCLPSTHNLEDSLYDNGSDLLNYLKHSLSLDDEHIMHRSGKKFPLSQSIGQSLNSEIILRSELMGTALPPHSGNTDLLPVDSIMNFSSQVISATPNGISTKTAAYYHSHENLYASNEPMLVIHAPIN